MSIVHDPADPAPHGPLPDAPEPGILLVEDDPGIARLLVDLLAGQGLRARAVGSATAMDAVLADGGIDLIVLDVMLPGEDGFSICARLRAQSAIPIIMVTARGEDGDRIAGLDIGADDYVTKPFNSGELVARIRALLRRSRMTAAMAAGQAAAPLRPPPLGFAGWRIDLGARVLEDPDGVRVALTSVEFDILAAFCRHPGQVLSRDFLIERANGRLAGAETRTVDVHVSRIRQKIEPVPHEPAFIRTVRLGGYVFTPMVRPC